MDRDMVRQVGHLLRPLAARIANTAARAVVQLVDDAKKLQLLQIGVLAEETIDEAEHMQPYGFSSVPHAGAEAVVVFPNGDRSHPLVVSVADRRHRPTGGAAGEVVMYHSSGSTIRMKASGDIEVTAAGKTIFHGASTAAGPTGEGVVVGTGIDPFTGQTYSALGACSSKVFAKK
jgi:phage baseplate assembly protein V